MSKKESPLFVKRGALKENDMKDSYSQIFTLIKERLGSMSVEERTTYLEQEISKERPDIIIVDLLVSMGAKMPKIKKETKPKGMDKVEKDFNLELMNEHPDLDKIKSYITAHKGLDVNRYLITGITLLHYAINKVDYPLVKLLIERNVDVNRFPLPKGDSAIMIERRYHRATPIQYALNVVFSWRHGYDKISSDVGTDLVSIIEELIKANADITIMDESGAFSPQSFIETHLKDLIHTLKF